MFFILNYPHVDFHIIKLLKFIFDFFLLAYTEEPVKKKKKKDKKKRKEIDEQVEVQEVTQC